MAHDRSTTGRGGVLLLAFAVLAAGIGGLTEGPRPVDAAEPAPAPASSPPDCPERLQNPGFEDGQKGYVEIPHWSRGDSMSVKRGGGAFEGRQYLATSSAHKLVTTSQDIDTLPGDFVYWELQHKKGTEDHFRMSGVVLANLTTAGGWNKYSGTHEVPAGRTTTAVELYVRGESSTVHGSAFDAIVIKLTCQLEITADFTGFDRDNDGEVGDKDGADGSVGDKALFSFTVKNKGTAGLKYLDVSDSEGRTLSCETEANVGVADGTVLPGNDDRTIDDDDDHEIVCKAAFSVEQADVDRGSVVGEATATGYDAKAAKRRAEGSEPTTVSPTVRDSAGESATTVAAAPQMMLTPGTVTPPSGQADAGDTASYSFRARNTGNVSLETVAVPGATTVKCDPAVSSSAPLGPDASTRCTAVFKLTQAHLDDGLTAVVTASPKRGAEQTRILPAATLTAAPAVSLDKKADAKRPVKAGSEVSYSFAVTNMGNVTLSEVSVADPKAGKVTCPQASLAPGKKTTCTATYAATAADITAGVIENTATVTAVTPGKKRVTASGSVSVSTEPARGGLGRIAGKERYSTAALISKETFAPGVEAVYVATGVNFPDALAGSAASGGDGPILLVTKDAIPGATLTELKRLKPKKIIVLGGTGVVSQAVESALQKEGATTRQSGSDRYSTAAAISAKHFQPGAAVAFVATGEDFPDALTGGPAAAALGGPILLTQKAKLPSATISELKRLKPKRIVVVGGTGVVSAAVEKALASYTAGEVSRLAGADRYSTGAAISKDAFKAGVPVAYIATGLNFPDALAGGAAGAFKDGPVLLVAKDSIPKATAAELTRLKPRSIIVLGGEAVVPKKIKTALGAYLAKTP